MKNGPKLPVVALPRSEVEVGGQRVIVNAAGDEIAYVAFDEDAEAFALAVNMHDELVDALRCIRDTFRKDLAQGFKTRDKEFAVMIADEVLDKMEQPK